MGVKGAYMSSSMAGTAVGGAATAYLELWAHTGGVRGCVEKWGGGRGVVLLLLLLQPGACGYEALLLPRCPDTSASAAVQHAVQHV